MSFEMLVLLALIVALLVLAITHHLTVKAMTAEWAKLNASAHTAWADLTRELLRLHAATSGPPVPANSGAGASEAQPARPAVSPAPKDPSPIFNRVKPDSSVPPVAPGLSVEFWNPWIASWQRGTTVVFNTPFARGLVGIDVSGAILLYEGSSLRVPSNTFLTQYGDFIDAKTGYRNVTMDVSEKVLPYWYSGPLPDPTKVTKES